MSDHLIRDVRPLGHPPGDVLVRAGRFAAFGQGLAAQPGTAVEDGAGALMLPGLIESHAHLDKTLWGLPWRPVTGGPVLRDYIENEARVLAEVAAPIEERAGNLVRRYVETGTTHIRSHVDVNAGIALGHVEAMLRVRETYRDVVGMDLVAFPQWGILANPGTADLMDAAIAAGVETVGGIDPAGIDGDPIRHLEIVFGIASRRGCGLDIHLHDGGELGAWQIERIIDFTAAAGLAGRVLISHAYCLGMIPEQRMEAIGRRLADQRIALMTTAPADWPVPPVARLVAMGVTVACGCDGVRDAWSPFANADMLERAMLLAYRFDWARDPQLESAFDAITAAAARAIGLADHGLSVGRDADFVLVPATTVGEAVVTRPVRSLVVRRGRVTARAGRFAA